jgi:hypothetical protein
MCVFKTLAGWLGRLVLFWRPNDLDGLDDRLRRDAGLPRRTSRPDAATLLDMSKPGGRRW